MVSTRGDDAEGIQIFVPACQGGDTDTVLFDLVVDAPGPVLDVLWLGPRGLRRKNGDEGLFRDVLTAEIFGVVDQLADEGCFVPSVQPAVAGQAVHALH